MVSSLAYDDTIEEADCIGAKGFLYKPLEKQTFLEALEQAMAEKAGQHKAVVLLHQGGQLPVQHRGHRVPLGVNGVGSLNPYQIIE